MRDRAGLHTAWRRYAPGVGLFVVAACVFFFLGRWILESRVPGARREVAARYDASRIAKELAAHPD